MGLFNPCLRTFAAVQHAPFDARFEPLDFAPVYLSPFAFRTPISDGKEPEPLDDLDGPQGYKNLPGDSERSAESHRDRRRITLS